MEDFAHFMFGICGTLLLCSSSCLRLLVASIRSQKRYMYGSPFVSPNNLLVSTINAFGAGIGIIYIIIFIKLAPKKEKLKIIGLFAFVLILFLLVVLVSLFALDHYPRKLFCGLLASIFSIVMFGSPLSIMKLVIRMPFFLSLIMFLCAASFFVFGVLGRDLFVAVPNGVGTALGTMQLIVYSEYRENRGRSSGLEMGETKPNSPTREAI